MINLDNLFDSITYNVAGVEGLLNQKQDLLLQLKDTENEINDFDNKIKFIEETKQYYIKAVDIMYEESIGALKDTLNTALQYIMFDKNYACNLTLEDKRGTKNLYISLIDLDCDNAEVDVKDGVGQGVRTIISFVLKFYYLINQGSKILFLDEKYSNLSAHYLSNMFEFMRKLCEEKGIIVVMITHDARFMDYADKTYLINDGNVSEATGDTQVEQLKEKKVVEKEENTVPRTRSRNKK